MIRAKTIKKLLPYFCSIFFLLPFGVNLHADEPGTGSRSSNTSAPVKLAISPTVTETGKISLSVDGLGTNDASGIIQVEKPAGAKVRSAYMAAASTGFSGRTLANGDVTIDGVGVNWDSTVPSSIQSSNSFANVTSMVKAKIDAASAGRVDFTITEVNAGGIDGEILAVIFDDPNQTTSNTIILLFGAQNIAGDTFNIGLGAPINKADPKLVIDLSLGISFGFQGSTQFSTVDVNGTRMSSSAGGQDDGIPISGANGALFTVGGLDDTNDNPDPNAPPDGPRTDDELYNLLPFVNNGDTSISVFTKNPSTDDNIFFAALNLTSATAVVGEGIILTPASATNPLNTQHTVTAKVQDDKGDPLGGRLITFSIISGPNAGKVGTDTTDTNGKATFTYTGTVAGTDTIEASFVDDNEKTITSNQVTKTWEGGGGKAASIKASPSLLKIKARKSRDVTITVKGEDGRPFKGAMVRAFIKDRDKDFVLVSPAKHVTDKKGMATFTVTCWQVGHNERGNVYIKFKADGLNKSAIVQVMLGEMPPP